MRDLAVRGIWLALWIVVLAGSHPAKAQWAIYGEGTGASLNNAGAVHLYGGTFGFYDQKGSGTVQAGLDFRGAILGAGNVQGLYTNQRLDYGAFGARVAAKPLYGRYIPYVEGLVGVGYFCEGVGITRQDNKSGNLQAVGGLDVKIRGRIQWRVAEFSYGRLRGSLYAVHPEVVSTGIVIQLP